MAAAILKLENVNTSAMERVILMKFGIVMRLNSPGTVSHYNFANLKIHDGGNRHHEKNEKSQYTQRHVKPSKLLLFFI